MPRLLQQVIQGYRYFVSPWLGNNCRFVPSCAEYAGDAIARYGALKGSCLALRRLSRCHPWCDGGYDPLV